MSWRTCGFASAALIVEGGGGVGGDGDGDGEGVREGRPLRCCGAGGPLLLPLPAAGAAEGGGLRAAEAEPDLRAGGSGGRLCEGGGRLCEGGAAACAGGGDASGVARSEFEGSGGSVAALPPAPRVDGSAAAAATAEPSSSPASSAAAGLRGGGRMCVARKRAMAGMTTSSPAHPAWPMLRT